MADATTSEPAGSPKRRAVIIGAGLSGLTCGVLLAEHGWDVTILEAHAIPGGLMQRFRRGPFWFDTGFHFITGSDPGGIFRRMARRLGIAERIEWLPLDEARQYQVHLPEGGAPVELPAGLDACERAIGARWPEQAAAVSRFFAEVRTSMAATGWLLPAPPEGQPDRIATRTVSEALAAHGVTGRAADVLGCLAAILAMRPERCPLELYAAFAGSAICGSWRAEGGGEAVAKPMVDRFRELGGKLLLKRGAERIVWTDRDAEAVEDVKGERHACDLCIATCHPTEALRLTGPGGMRPSLVEKIEHTPDSESVVLAYAALDRRPECLGRSHHFARFGADGDLYYLAPSEFHEVPEAPHYLEAMIWVPTAATAAWRDTRRGARSPEYEAWKSDLVDRILARVVELHPELAGSITRTWGATPLSVQHYVRSRNGAAMGLSHDLAHLGTDPIPRRSRLKNLFFAGQSVGHPGVLGTMIGSMILCENILGVDLRSQVVGAGAPTTGRGS